MVHYSSAYIIDTQKRYYDMWDSKSDVPSIVMVHYSSAYIIDTQKRYYDMWDSKSDVPSDGYVGSIKVFPLSQKSHKKDDPCANKPLWYLKYQARLGKLSPFYDCLSGHGI
ncbi:unnamed protein product [Rotaria magnacalcarata]|nr:unnamed protein product [Rotaria magnacalcarata]